MEPLPSTSENAFEGTSSSLIPTDEDETEVSTSDDGDYSEIHQHQQMGEKLFSPVMRLLNSVNSYSVLDAMSK